LLKAIPRFPTPLEAPVAVGVYAAVLRVVGVALVMMVVAGTEMTGWTTTDTEDVPAATEVDDGLPVTRRAPMTALLGFVYPIADLR
jgi:hypothetical protein